VITRLNVLLLMALLASCIYLVRVSYDARRLFAEIDQAQTAEARLNTEFERLQTEQRSQATPLLVEKIARQKLNMRTATPAITHYVGYERNDRAASSGDVAGAAK
jgi:cell division protein FtsL